ncbi:Uma2 family endonuclease [Streptosporangium sp. KLBMP 9127]|nr:Uma2 family endonuclease [Streptosporangium sp. KLBMP 9127]
MVKVLDRPMQETFQSDTDQIYRRTCDLFPDSRVEVINGRVVVGEMTTGDHSSLVFRLLAQLLPTVTQQGWEIWQGIILFLGPQMDRYIPDLTVVPEKPRMWGSDHVYADGICLAVEVVSKSSSHDDHVIKPRNCATANVPLLLVVDQFQGTAKLFRYPSEDGYAHVTEVRLGGALRLPEPWDLTIDTGKLIG